MAGTNVDTEDELENFRRQWETELSANRMQSNENRATGKPFRSGTEHDNEEKAASMYLCGVRHEQTGDVVQAIKFYKRALHLVPDIEDKIYSYTNKLKSSANTNEEPAAGNNLTEGNNNSVDEEDVQDEIVVDLLEKFTRIVQHDGTICQPLDDPKATHISILPREIIIYLLKWVVSSDLDLRSLEQISLVCRGFYVCTRDNEIWKLACLRMWSTDKQCLPKSLGFTTYREMFISRPRIQFNGCYISKTSYVRPGENSFQDSNYQPWHMVNYYRYLRFYSDGTALMSTTADLPAQVVSKRLKKKDPTCWQGGYVLNGNTVTCVFKRKRNTEKQRIVNSRRNQRNRLEDVNNNGSQLSEQIFQLDLEIRTVKGRLYCALYWIRYTIQNIYHGHQESTTTTFDVQQPSRFPPLWFSRVKSYNTQSDKPL